MPLTGDAKRRWDRNNVRTKRYGNWRQLFFDSMGMCETCGTTVELDIHEAHDDGVNETVTSYHLLCLHCHLDGVHNGSPNIEGRFRKYVSHLAEDVHREMLSCGSVENWMGTYHVHNTDPDKFAYWESFIAALREPETPVAD